MGHMWLMPIWGITVPESDNTLGEIAAEQIEHGQEALEQTTGLLTGLWQKFLDFLPTLLIALIIFLIGMVIARLIDRVIGHTLKKAKADPTATGFGHSLVRILLYTVLIIICLSVLGVPMASIITVVGAAGVTIGLALQNSLSNLAGGFVLLFAKPFQAGDYIITNGEEGYVEQINILYTQLLTRDHRKIYLPNSVVSGGAVVNLSQKGTLRIAVPLTVSYDANLDRVRTVLLESVGHLKCILHKPAPMVSVTELGDSGVHLSVLVWVDQADYFAAPSKVLECAKHALDTAGIEIPYPKLDVQMQQTTQKETSHNHAAENEIEEAEKR